MISSRETAVKTKNLARDPRAALCVLNDGFYGSWCFVNGSCEIVHLPAAMDGLVAYYRGLAGEHPTGTTTARWTGAAGAPAGLVRVRGAERLG